MISNWAPGIRSATARQRGGRAVGSRPPARRSVRATISARAAEGLAETREEHAHSGLERVRHHRAGHGCIALPNAWAPIGAAVVVIVVLLVARLVVNNH
jgi:hypothetical protein